MDKAERNQRAIDVLEGFANGDEQEQKESYQVLVDAGICPPAKLKPQAELYAANRRIVVLERTLREIDKMLDDAPPQVGIREPYDWPGICKQRAQAVLKGARADYLDDPELARFIAAARTATTCAKPCAIMVSVEQQAAILRALDCERKG
jgi:hypothetical protein